jgi:hypothetical protein
MKVKCFTPILEVEVVKRAVSGLKFHIRNKLVNQTFIELAQLGEKVCQINK